MSQEQAYLGSYRITGTLGQGAFGIVFQAYQPFLDRQVAIKTLQNARTTDAGQEQGFMREARTIARLRHNNIVNVYEFATAPLEGQPVTYMVMEYLPKDTLEDRLKQRGRLDVLETVTILERLASALDYAHTHHVIHRDLKPANILFNEADEPVIVDFGLAKLAEMSGAEKSSDHPGESSLMGTPAYMAPEQVLQIEVTPAADQFALAMIAFQMLAGRLPFDMHKAMGEILTDRIQSSPEILHEVAPEFDERVSEVLERALDREPESRYPSAGEFVRELGNALMPERAQSNVVVVVDPVQAALLRAARQSIAGAMWGAVFYVIGVALVMVALVANGYQSGSPIMFAWDGVVASLRPDEDGWRTVMGVWWNSPAERAGIIAGDRIYGDLRVDTAQTDGKYSINGLPRSEYRRGFQPGDGDVIERTLERGGQTLNVTYTLERSTFPALVLLLTLPAGALYLGCAAWLLRRWGAEPGLQVLFVLMLGATLYVVTSVTLDIFPTINLSVSFLLAAANTHIMLIFPQPLAYIQRHPRLPWLLYVPALVPIAIFLGGQTFSSVVLNMLLGLLVAYTVMYSSLLIFKWWRVERLLYPGLGWMIAGMVFVIVSAVSSILITGITYQQATALGITGNFLMIALYLIRAASSLVIAPLITYGYHSIQSAMGASLPPPDGLAETALFSSMSNTLFPAATLKSTGGRSTTGLKSTKG